MESKDIEERLKELKYQQLQLMKEQQRRIKTRRIESIYPDQGRLSRHNYPKHCEFMGAGKEYNQRLFMAGNRLGKTLTGAYEMALHLTGEYPHWWDGAEFDSPIDAWAAGKSNETTRDIVQLELFGNVVGSGRSKTVDGTGMIKSDLILRESITWRNGVSNLIDKASVLYKTGGISTIGLKSYEQGRGSFEGTSKEVVWLDEEPPRDVYTECLARTFSVDGILYVTFTPLEGMTETVMQFLPHGIEQLRREEGLV